MSLSRKKGPTRDRPGGPRGWGNSAWKNYMLGQLALLPAAGGAGVAGAVLDEPESDCDELEAEPVLELELSDWPHATDAPPPTSAPVSASPARACFIRSVMSFTSL